jgi:hypothetical protein
MLSKFYTVFGSVAVFLGIIVTMGAAGDCDGKCMDQANDTATMIMLAVTGLIMMLGGAFAILAGESLRD